MITAAVGAGDTSFPLSTAYETWKARARWRASRATMRSRRPWRLLPAELDRALRRRFGRPQTLLSLQPFGWGMRHAPGRARRSSRARSVRRSSRRTTRPARGLADWVDAVLLGSPRSSSGPAQSPRRAEAELTGARQHAGAVAAQRPQRHRLSAAVAYCDVAVTEREWGAQDVRPQRRHRALRDQSTHRPSGISPPVHTRGASRS